MKMMEKLNAKKKDNKGFSLVELIIVIAIMAILVGIVGTQVVPYIEKSRKAKDIQVLSGYSTDAMTAYSSNAATLDASAVYTITITPGASAWSVAVTGGTATEQTTLQNAFTELNSITTSAPKFESKAGKAITSITITCQNAKPMVKVVTATTDGSFDDIESN